MTSIVTELRKRNADLEEILRKALPSLERLATEEARSALGPKGKIAPTMTQRNILKLAQDALRAENKGIEA